MKKIYIFAAVAVVALALTASTASAKPGNGTPFEELWDEIADVRTELAAVSGVIEDPDAWVESFFDVFMSIEGHDQDVAELQGQIDGHDGEIAGLQSQIDDLQSLVAELETTCTDCCDQEPACVPTDEVCDGTDNDCDGAVDESFPEDGDSCSTGLYGICSNGVRSCSEGGLSCTQLNQPMAEVCNGIDDDCDGSVDEGLACEDGCIDLDDPNTFGDDITYDVIYGTMYLRDDVRLCPGTYDMAGRSIRMFQQSGAGMLDCDGATLIGGGMIAGASGAIFAGCSSTTPTQVCGTDITIQNCVIENFNVAISARGADHIVIRDNTLRDLNYGISLLGIVGGTISGNTLEDLVYTGISVNDSSMFPYQSSVGNVISDNDVSAVGNYGIDVMNSHDNEFTRNIVTGCGIYGIRLSDSGGNLIYDNSFTNGHNAYSPVSGLHNDWNAAPYAGTNILGGGKIGGNYWSDYYGSDTDSDGIGDTDLPHTSGGYIGGGDGDGAPLVP